MRLGKYTLDFRRTLIMGILNVTPDSFSNGGLFIDTSKAIAHAKEMVKDGADIIDVGGESTRPGSSSISEEEELNRIKPVIDRLLEELDVPISVDTYKPKVAEECLRAGVHLINDITGLRNAEMINVLSKYRAPAVIMHMKGTPLNMQNNPFYEDVVVEIKEFLQERKQEAERAGLKDLIIDPGIGFGKTTMHNLEIIRRLGEFKSLGSPILIGPSRKSFIGEITNLPVSERVEGTIASISIAIMNGANIIRVHDVKECKRAALVADAIKQAR
jgi:dihydropteroate synthase